MIKFSSPYSQPQCSFMVADELECLRVIFLVKKKANEETLYLTYTLEKSDSSPEKFVKSLKQKTEDLKQIKDWDKSKFLKELKDPIVYHFLDAIDAYLDNQSVHEWVVEHIPKHQQPWNHVNLNYIRGNLG
jgi:hypothetical protein